MQPASSPAHPGALAPGVVVSGRYQLLRPLGRGGMGSVWAAYHLGLNTEVALKFVELEAGERESLLARFRNEAMAVAHVKSSNVISVLDYGYDEALGRPFLAMELLGGESLGARLEREGRLPLSDVVEIVRQACRGLGRAHASGIVHRDVKPDNLFLCPEEDTTVVKVLDFGVAKASVLSGGVAYKTTAGSLIGTPMYMSPEQALGNRPIDHRSDLFSLGVVAYHCLTGRPPFEATGLGELLVAIGTRPFPLPTALNPGLPPAVEQWLCRALEKDPDRRFQSAKEMAGALLAACDMAPHDVSRPLRHVAPTWRDTELATPLPPVVPVAITPPRTPIKPTVDQVTARTQSADHARPAALEGPQGEPATFAGTASTRSRRSDRPQVPMSRPPFIALAGVAALAVAAGLSISLLRRQNGAEHPSAPSATSATSATSAPSPSPLPVSALLPSASAPSPPSPPPAPTPTPPPASDAGAPDAGSKGSTPKEVRPSPPPKRGTGKGGFQL